MMSRNPTVLIVNDTAFAHGGLLPTHGERRRLRAWGQVAARCVCSAALQRVLLHATPHSRPTIRTNPPNQIPSVQYGIEKMNAEVAAWMRRDKTEDGFASPPFLAMGDGKSVMWNRQLSVEKWVNPVDRYRATSLVSQALSGVGAKRLVVGHTPQMRGANAECDGLVWRIDVGMSSGVLDAPVAVLEITRDGSGESQCRVIQGREEVASYDEQAAMVDF